MSAAARLAAHGRTLVLEAENAFGYHSSGRSATFSHLGIGNPPVRGLTAYSRAYLEGSTGDCNPLSQADPALFVARVDMVEALNALEAEMQRFFNGIERVDERTIAELIPVIRCGESGVVAGLLDHSARRIDSDALQQGYRLEVKRNGGECVRDARVATIRREGVNWALRTEAGERFSAPILINAAGAWCNEIAQLAGVEPLGLQPLRRTIIAFNPGAGRDATRWPFTKTAVDDFYMLPQSGALLASPVDEVPSDPTDAQPEEYDIALAAAKVEEYTSLQVRRVSHSWAGLRTFTRDRVPVAGYASDADGFFWIAGQGGYGLQTSPAMSEITEALITGGSWPSGLRDRGVMPETLAPSRLSSSAI